MDVSRDVIRLCNPLIEIQLSLQPMSDLGCTMEGIKKERWIGMICGATCASQSRLFDNYIELILITTVGHYLTCALVRVSSERILGSQVVSIPTTTHLSPVRIHI